MGSMGIVGAISSMGSMRYKEAASHFHEALYIKRISQKLLSNQQKRGTQIKLYPS